MIRGRWEKTAVGALAGVSALALAGALWAGDFWREKPAAAWTAEEALQLLLDSPWAKKKLALSSLEARRKYRATQNPAPREGPPEFPTGRVALGSDHPLETYLVRWESARPVAAAFERLRDLGEETSAEFQAPPPILPADRYVVTIKTLQPPLAGLDVIEGLEAGELLERARLKTPRGEVNPIEVARSGVGANAAVHFFFGREHKSQPLLRARSEVVEFVFKGKRMTLKQKFRLEPQDLR
ncbi:MAG: hypothetical protein ACRD4U_00975 [Candidatus Acidiferrales bacterium]